MKSKHHIIPRSRNGSQFKSNIAIVSVKSHQRYHTLFGKRTPTEILDYLVNYFWKGDKRFLR